MCDSLFKPVLAELEELYTREDALKIYCISILRVCNPSIKDRDLQDAYQESFLSEKYPKVGMSKNTVSRFLNILGRNCSRITEFMRNRVNAVSADAHLLIDGTLKTNNSIVNTLSEFSRKSRIKGTKDISILYAFDLEKNEPVCSKCYPGNMLDLRAYSDFISENKITKGLIVGDKGFSSGSAESEFEANKELHYLNPIKKNSKFISTHKMYDFDSTLAGYDGILYKKAKVSGKQKWLYSFRSSAAVDKEEMDYLRNAKEKETYDAASFRQMQSRFGTIVLECDLDITPEQVYKAYSDRWEIEIVMRYYKTSCDFGTTREHDNYSVIASEFCDFLSCLLTYKLINKFDSCKLLEKHTYGEIMKQLRKAKKSQYKQQGWNLIRINLGIKELMEDLGLQIS